RAEQVGGERLLPDLHPLLVCGALEGMVAAPAAVLPRCGEHRCVVDEDVDPLESRDRLTGQSFDVGRVTEVSLDQGVAGSGERVAYLLGCIGAAQVVHDHPVTAISEGTRDRGTDTTG